MGVIVLAMVVLIGFVVPRFAASFAGGTASLPLLTRLLATFGESMSSYWWLYAGVTACVITGIVLSWKDPRGRIRIERIVPRVPVVGPIAVAVATARFSRVLGLSLGSGLDLVEAVELAGRATGNRAFAQRTTAMVSALRRGEALPALLTRAGLLPGFATRLLSAGKDASELARACVIVADHYDEQSDHRTKGLTSVIEPLLTLVMAVVVLVVALSVFQPMWQSVSMSR
jgi:type II secretory pathway component PulF